MHKAVMVTALQSSHSEERQGTEGPLRGAVKQIHPSFITQGLDLYQGLDTFHDEEPGAER